MNSITITNDNLDSINWEGDCFKYCVFESFKIEGKHIDRDFIDCEFHNCNFIKDNLNGACSFENARAYNCKADRCSDLKIPIWLTKSSSGRAKGARR